MYTAENDFYGGSAIFLSSKTGLILRCTFVNNSVKFLNDHNDNSKLLLDEKQSFSIIECNFEISKDSKYALFYDAGIDGTRMEINNCFFSGHLDDDAHFIEARLLKKNSPMLAIKSCRFSGPNNQSVLIKEMKQDFKYEILENRKAYEFILLAASACAVAIFLVIIFVVASKMKNYSNNIQDDNEISL